LRWGDSEAILSEMLAVGILKRPWLLAFLLWEAWWAYEFLSAPSPDEEMRTVFALMMGVFLPLLVLVPYFLIQVARRNARSRG